MDHRRSTTLFLFLPFGLLLFLLLLVAMFGGGLLSSIGPPSGPPPPEDDPDPIPPPLDDMVGEVGIHGDVDRDRPGASPSRLGRISGRAVGINGRPLVGVLDVVLVEEVFVTAHQCALAEENGAFVLVGIAPGPRQIFLEGGDRREHVIVPEGGEVSVELVSSRSAHEHYTARWTETDEGLMIACSSRIADLQLKLQVLEDQQVLAGRAEVPEAFVAERAQTQEQSERADEKLQAILTKWRATGGPLRPVVVKELPARSPAVLTASRWGSRWVMEVRNGLVEFPALVEGTWRMTFVGSDGERAAWWLEVPAGEGRFEATFPGR